MADSLRKLLNVDGQLATTSLAGAQEMTGQQQAPTSPAQAAAIGASPDAAKMAGTGAQKAGALNGAQTLQQTMTLNQPRTQATDQEKQQLSGAQNAQALQGLGQQVQGLANQDIQKAVTAATQQAGAGPVSTAGAANQPQAVQDALAKISKNPQDTQALADLSNQLGHQVTQDELTQLMGGTAGIGSAAVGANVKQNLTTSQLPPQMLSQASQLLGQDVSKLTVPQLIDQINQEVQKDYGQVNDLNNRLNDPSLGAAERAEIRSQLRDMGAVGVRAAESTTEKIADDLQKNETVKFNGSDVPLNQLLSSDYVAGLVQNYLSDPSSDASKQLKQQEPDLAKLIDQYQPVLQAAVSGLGAGVGQFAAIQQKNQQLANIDLGNGQKTQISDDIMKKLVPSWGQMTGQPINPSSQGVVAYLNSTGAASTDKKTATDNLNAISTANPDFVTQMQGWSVQQAQNALVTNADKTTAALNQYSALKKIDPVNYTTDEVANLFGFGSSTDMQKQVLDAAHRRASGLFGDIPTPGQSGIIANAKGEIDWGKTLQNVRSKTPQDLASLVGGGTPNFTAMAGTNVKDVTTKAYNPTSESAYEKLQGDPTGRTLGIDEIKSITGSATWDKLSKPVQVSLQGKLNADAQAKQTAQINTTISSATNNQASSIGDLQKALTAPASDFKNQTSTDTLLNKTLDSLRTDLKAAGTGTRADALRSTIGTLQKQLDTYDTASVKSFNDKYNFVQSDAEKSINRFTPFNDLGKLQAALHAGTIDGPGLDGVRRTVAALQDASRTAHAKGDTVTMNDYDGVWQALQKQLDNYRPAQQGGSTLDQIPGVKQVLDTASAVENPLKALRTQVLTPAALSGQGSGLEQGVQQGLSDAGGQLSKAFKRMF